MPDFDVDFDERRRGEVIRYVTEKYGDDRVAQIVTYGTIKAKQAMKDSARVLGYPYALGDQLTKLMPPAVMGKDIPLGGIFDPPHKRYTEAGEFRARYETDPDAKRVVDTARGLENLKRQWGVHAAGVIMSSEPLLDVVPIMKREQDGQIITQFDYPSCEALGLVKMDFLGLRNLTDPRRRAAQHRGQPRPAHRPRRAEQGPHRRSRPTTCWPAATPSASSSSTAARCARCCGLMRPDSFEDISAVGALYRPGPMGAGSHTKYALRKNGQEPITPIHPELAAAAGGRAGRDLRADRLPGAGHPDRPEARRLLARQGRPAAQGDGQEEARGARRRVRRLLRGHDGQRLLDGGHQDAVGHPRPVLRLRVQQGAHRGLRPGVLLDGLPQGQLPGRVHGRPAHQRARRQGQVRALPQRVPAHGHQGAAAGRQRVGRRLHAARHRHPVRPVRDPQRRRERRRLDRGDPRGQGPVHSTSTTSCARSTRSPATRRPSSR